MKNIISIKQVIFSIINNQLYLYLPDLSLPHNTITHNTTLEQTVEEIFTQSLHTPLGDRFCEQLYTIPLHAQSVDEIAIVYYALVPSSLVGNHSPHWYAYSAIAPAHPEYHIITYAVQRLRWKIEYTNVVYSLLPEEFTLSELQQVYEAILGKNLDKRNFRKKILSLHFIYKTGKKRSGIARPALMYSFTQRKPVLVNIFS